MSRHVLALFAALVLVSASVAQAQTLRLQTAWPESSLYFEQTRQLAALLARLSDGRLRAETVAPGDTRPEQIVVAVHRGKVDAAHAFTWYSAGADKTAILLSGSPGGSFGMDHLDFLGWIHDGGGLAYYRRFYAEALKADVFVLPILPAAHQPLGWFRRPIDSLDEFRKMRCRQTGIAAEIYRAMGMAVVDVPARQMQALLERGELDCAEWAGAAEDQRLGLHRQLRFHYTPGLVERVSTGELMIRAATWNALGEREREWIRTASVELFMRWLMTHARLNAQALGELTERHGVVVRQPPPDVLVEMLKAWDAIAAQEAAKNPLFREVLESQRAYAAKVVPVRRQVVPPYSFLANYYWPPRP